MNWAKDTYDTIYQFNPKTTSYKCQIRKIEKHNDIKVLFPQTK